MTRWLAVPKIVWVTLPPITAVAENPTALGQDLSADLALPAEEKVLQSPTFQLGARCSWEQASLMLPRDSAPGESPWDSPPSPTAHRSMWLCLQGVSTLGSACGLYLHKHINKSSVQALSWSAISTLQQLQRKQRGSCFSPHSSSPFPCKGITAAFVLELLLCCKSVGAGVLCTPLCWPCAMGFTGVSAEEPFGAHGLLTLECCSL